MLVAAYSASVNSILISSGFISAAQNLTAAFPQTADREGERDYKGKYSVLLADRRFL